MITDLWILALVLVSGHFLCDYPLQGPYLSEVKNLYKPENKDLPSNLLLFGHATIHGAFVAVVTGWAFFGYMEVIIHYGLDRMKCRGLISFKEDQYAHLFCKLLYFLGVIFHQWLVATFG